MTDNNELEIVSTNQMPTPMEIFAEKIKTNYPEHISFAERLIASEGKIPAVVDNDTDSGKLGDFIKQAKGAIKTLDGLRSAEKEPFVEKGRMVDGFFKNYMEKLKKISDKANEVQSAYLKKKEDEERRRREEEARKLREQQEEQLREAQRIAKEAEEARKAQEEEAKRIAKEAEEKQKEIQRKAEEERKKQEDEIARLKAEAAEAVRLDALTKAALKEAEAKIKEINKEEKSELKEVVSDVKEAEKSLKTLDKLVKEADRESVKMLDNAIRTEKQAEKMEALAGASSADLARTRGFEGSLSTVRTSLVGIISSREELDLETLRPYFRDSDLQFAVDQFVKTYGQTKTIKGVTVIEDAKAVVR